MSRLGSGQWLRAFRIAGLGGVFLLGLGVAHGQATAEGDAIRERIAALDHESFAERQRATAALLEIGEPAVPLLVKGSQAESAELRGATELLGLINGRRLEREFKAFGERADDAIDVEHGMWLIALMLDPEVTKESIVERLDAMAAAVRRRIGVGVDPGSLSAKEIMGVVTAVLGDEIGLKGDQAAYDHPDNSSIHRALEQKDGLPIVLSEIAVAVGRRLDVPIVGLPVPGRYMIMCRGRRDRGEAPKGNVIVDPFGGWATLSREALLRAFRFTDPELLFSPTSARKTLVRMLNNIESDFLVVGNDRQAKAAGRYLALLEGDGDF